MEMWYNTISDKCILQINNALKRGQVDPQLAPINTVKPCVTYEVEKYNLVGSRISYLSILFQLWVSDSIYALFCHLHWSEVWTVFWPDVYFSDLNKNFIQSCWLSLTLLIGMFNKNLVVASIYMGGEKKKASWAEERKKDRQKKKKPKSQKTILFHCN